MRKWMSERFKRRKKDAESTPSGPAPTPLQPAYFDAASTDDQAEARDSEVKADASVAAAHDSAPPKAIRSAAPTGQRDAGGPRRKRRRRGGRGRGRDGAEGAPAAQPAPAVGSQPAIAAAPASSRVPKGTVILAIGLPGSGKSSWFKRNNITALSTDMVRLILFDDETEQRFQDLVFSNLRSMLKARLIARRPMNYVDATNLTPHERQGWIKLAKDFGYEVQAVYFDVPLEVCLERNQKRERKVEDDVMRRMAAKLKPPTFEEGFTKITMVRVKKKGDQIAEPATTSQ